MSELQKLKNELRMRDCDTGATDLWEEVQDAPNTAGFGPENACLGDSSTMTASRTRMTGVEGERLVPTLRRSSIAEGERSIV